jgi:multiple sugar transport system permease protein
VTRSRGGRRRETWAGWLFALPWLISLVVFTAYPVLGTLALSFTDYAVVDAPHWVGLDNYEAMLTTDPAFWTAVENSAFYAAVSVPLKLVLALALALLLDRTVAGIGFYRLLFYLPALVPPVAGTIVFMLLLTPNAGPVNVLLGMVGIGAPDWLKDPDAAIWALILLSLWPLGIETLVFLAGLKEIPQEILDAASIDGARRWRRLLRITLPMLSPVILFNLVIGVIGSFQVFTQALVIGGTTGRPQDSTLMFLVLIYRTAFRYFNMGYAAALSVFLFLVVLVLTLLIFRSSRSWVHYAEEHR